MKKENKRISILIINYEFPPLGGGAGNATYFILKEFSDKVKYPNIKIHLITSSIDEDRQENFSENIIIHFLKIGKKGNLHYQSMKDLVNFTHKSYFFTKKLLKNSRFDLIHAFFALPSGLVASQFHLPYIVSLRGSDVPFYNERFRVLDTVLFQWLFKYICKKACSVVANSMGLKELALNSMSKKEVDIIPNGIDTRFFIPDVDTKENGKLTLISTGRLIARKGYEYLINALSGTENVCLKLIGEGPLMNELKSLSNTLSVEVEFLGKKGREEIRHNLQAADIFVLPSLNEGMSNSILEAMACGLPIIATNVGGSEELIDDNGIVVAPRSIKEIQDAIVHYIDTPEDIKLHGQRSRSMAEQLSWGKVADKYLLQYNKILNI